MGQIRSYTKEYKIQAVKLALEIGITKASRELGVPDNTLYGWRRAYQDGRLDLGPGTQTPQGAMTLAEEVNMLRKQVKDLKKENRRLQEENDFLEEASAFFAASRQKSARATE